MNWYRPQDSEMYDALDKTDEELIEFASTFWDVDISKRDSDDLIGQGILINELAHRYEDAALESGVGFDDTYYYIGEEVQMLLARIAVHRNTAEIESVLMEGAL